MGANILLSKLISFKLMMRISPLITRIGYDFTFNLK